MTTNTTHHRSETARGMATGLLAFSAVMLFLVGILDIFRGIMAIAQNNLFVVTPSYVFRFNLTGWGWVHLGLGVVAVMVAVGLFSAATWARIGGVILASLVIIANFLSLPYYPLWSLILIALSVFIIWALCVVDPEEFRLERL